MSAESSCSLGARPEAANCIKAEFNNWGFSAGTTGAGAGEGIGAGAGLGRGIAATGDGMILGAEGGGY